MRVDGGDVAWVLVATALVWLMLLPGLALFYGGLVRANNLLSVLAQVLGIGAVTVLVWVWPARPPGMARRHASRSRRRARRRCARAKLSPGPADRGWWDKRARTDIADTGY